MTSVERSASTGDDGVVIVWALALVSILVLVGAVGAVVVDQATLRMRVAGVADLAALAAAQSPADACTAAAQVVAANGLVLAGCGRDGRDAVVTVAAGLPEVAARLVAALGGTVRTVTASARAGPP